jgi:NDP-sugar pyrophosphorylase family protein
LLPHARIGSGARITRSIIDERTDLDPESDYFNVNNTCRIGSDEEFIKNNDFPQSIFSSITLIGKDCRINEGARIGGGCFVASGLGEDFFLNNKYLYDGMSLLK